MAKFDRRKARRSMLLRNTILGGLPPSGDQTLTAQWDFTMSGLTGIKGPTLTFTRDSNAMFWNSDQQLQYAPHQLADNVLALDRGADAQGEIPTGWTAPTNTGTRTWDDSAGYGKCTFTASSQRPNIQETYTVVAGEIYTAYVYVHSLTGDPSVFLYTNGTAGTEGDVRTADYSTPDRDWETYAV